MAQIHQQTETAVANEALGALLLPPIADLDSDTSAAGRALKQHFASVRDAMQRQFPWNFCEREKRLLALPDAEPSAHYRFTYALPNDSYCLAARALHGHAREDWKVRGRNIIAHAGPAVTLIFTARITDVALWDALFRPAFSLALAVACKRLCKDEQIIAEVKQEASDALANAWPVDAAEGTPGCLPEQDVITARWC